MNKFRITLSTFAIMAFTMLVCSGAQAQQATRTWVSGTGDDANPCSRTAPCKTFAGAMPKTAVDGEINAIDPGGFGAVTITKSITIDGNGTHASILAAQGTGVIINMSSNSGSNTVTLRNISINGFGTGFFGVRILGSLVGMTVSIENCQIFGFRGNGLFSRGISDERTVAANLLVRDTIVKNNSGSGVVAIGAGGGVAELNNVQSLANGGSGIVVSAGNVNGGRRMLVRNCVATKNTGAGFLAENAARMDVINSQSTFNAQGIQSDSANTEVRVSRTTVTRNSSNGLSLGGGTILSYLTNEVSANVGNEVFTAGGPVLK